MSTPWLQNATLSAELAGIWYGMDQEFANIKERRKGIKAERLCLLLGLTILLFWVLDRPMGGQGANPQVVQAAPSN